MRFLSLWQPWASLVACGAKRIETRSWRTDYRGLVGIHAAKYRGELDWCADPVFRAALLGAGIRGPADLPFGAVLAVGTVRDCVRTDRLQVSGPEAAFGNYAPGRWAWYVTDCQRLVDPIPWAGKRGLWTDGLLTQVVTRALQ
jgi:hypothetical protein